MEDLKPVLTELYGFECRDKSLIIASMDFSEHRVFGARIKVFSFSTEWSSRITEFSFETLMEENKRELVGIYDFKICNKPMLKTVFGNFGLSGF